MHAGSTGNICVAQNLFKRPDKTYKHNTSNCRVQFGEDEVFLFP